MAEDQEYDEVPAVVRIPKGERLADSRKSEGWKCGFTPKTSDKGPEHVEIRLKAEKESGFTGKPEIVYVTEYVDDQRPQLTPGQQAVVDIAVQVIDGLVEIADVATAPSDPKATVTSEQFQQMFMTWLAREDAQQALWSLIVDAEVEDGGAATLAWQQELKELSPEQRTERVMEFLVTNPLILEDFARQLMGCMAIGLGETTLRRDRV
ncbi:hypothetical protein [Streptomyces sp. NPDC046887]|uniref:hypothetical protein n=1 Tax=Streptomyces sp. NPDC046887 TaxID=3155472 RepID=UPI0033BFE418